MKSEKRIFLSFILNLSFTIIEILGGFLTNSIALISDAVHDLGDSIALGSAMVLERKSKKKPDQAYTYGYHRFSLLGALISAITLIAGSLFIIVEAVKRLLNPETINTELLIYFAILGVIVNGLAAFNISKGASTNEKVITLHLIEDVIGWATLLIGAIVMHFTKIIALDALLSLVFTLFILRHVFKHLKEVFDVLLERAPKDFDIQEIKQTLEKLPHVLEVHHIHLWTLEGTVPLITLHALIEYGLEETKIQATQDALIQTLKDLGIIHSTVQLEWKSSTCQDANCEEEITPKNGAHKHHH